LQRYWQPKKKKTLHILNERETERTALADKTNYTLVWYTSYDLQPENGAAVPELIRGRVKEEETLEIGTRRSEAACRC